MALIKGTVASITRDASLDSRVLSRIHQNARESVLSRCSRRYNQTNLVFIEFLDACEGTGTVLISDTGWTSL